ncbi:ribosome maturation factor RimM [Myxococcota bacterium]
MKTLELGRITKPHGVRGELKVHVHWSGSQALRSLDSVIVRQAGEEDRIFPVLAVRSAHRVILLRLGGIDTIDQAEKLRGAVLHAERDRLPPLAEGEYYLADLVGVQVWAGDRELGRVIEVRVHPTVDAVVIETAEGKQMEQALLDCWLEEVDAVRGRVRLSSTDGLIEIE